MNSNNAANGSLLKINSTSIRVNGGNFLQEVQTAFNDSYPFLAMEFFNNEAGVPVRKNQKIDPRTFLKQLVLKDVSHVFDISPARTVAQVCGDFEHAFGLVVQLCRKSGNVWNRISLTEGWTLQQQNNAGECISREIAEAQDISRGDPAAFSHPAV